MFQFLMSAADSEKAPMFEWFNSDIDLLMALLYAVIGISVVICVLLILVGLLMIFEKIFSAIGKSDAKKQKTKEIEPTAVSEDEETVAAITAAIAMIYAEENGTQEVAPFTVRRIRQVSKFKNNR